MTAYRWIVAGLAVSFPLVAVADPAQQWLAGAEIAGDSRYVYLGLVVPLPGSRFGDGWVARGWVDGSTYRYDKNSVTIEARAPGLDAAVGYQQADAGGWWAAYLGAAWRDTRLSPDDPDNGVRGRQTRPKLQLEGEVNLPDSWRVAGIASYIAGQDAYWTRLRALKGEPGDWRFGGEAVLLGDPSYRATQLGAVMVLPRTGAWDWGFKLGARQVEGRSTRPYFGVELGAFF